MSNKATDPFFEEIGKFLGVSPGKIQVKHSQIPGEFMCIGPRPKPDKLIPDLSQVRNYCFTFVLKLEPPRFLCDAYRQEYDQLTEQLTALIQTEAWDDVAAVAQRLSDLEEAIRNTCSVRERVIKYCVFPDEWIEDPFASD